ncbi:MAG: cytochrome c oxidase subunit II [Vicinamibacterales bacterium]
MPITHPPDFRAVSLAFATALSLAACGGVQSSLTPAGEDAARIADLFWWMTTVAAMVWIATIALAFYCLRLQGTISARQSGMLIIGGGMIIPTIILTVLLFYGLASLPRAVARAPEGSLHVHVTGEQWWWRVRYDAPDGTAVHLANEIRLPVGEPVQLSLESDNVIHSFWVPSLAGKMDMIPGRTTYLTLRPTTTGVFRGSCAEYCGTAHALMALYVEVVPRDEFDRWLSSQRTDAAAPAQEESAGVSGRRLFESSGCGACHTIRGTDANGTIGPDLTHVASRHSLGAGVLPNGLQALTRWIAGTEEIKPGVHMPGFGMLPDSDVRAIAAYLSGLE